MVSVTVSWQPRDVDEHVLLLDATVSELGKGNASSSVSADRRNELSKSTTPLCLTRKTRLNVRSMPQGWICNASEVRLRRTPSRNACAPGNIILNQCSQKIMDDLDILGVCLMRESRGVK